MKRVHYILFVLFIFAVAVAAQTPQKSEQELLGKLASLEKVSSYSGNYDENSTTKAQEDFKNSLLKALENPETLKYSFAKLGEQMYVATSPDGKFRIYSWDTQDGGTMHNFDAVYQYQSDAGKVFVKKREGGEEGDAGSFIGKIYEVLTKSGKVYLTVSSGIFSTQDSGQSVNAMKITGNSLDENVKIFQTREGLTNSIGFSYNFFSVYERKERPIILILFDASTNLLKIPVVIENKKFPNGEVTNRFINYKFNGTSFVNVK
jgi:hypothetical protein